MTIKFLDCHGCNSNVDLGTLGIIGTRDCTQVSSKVGFIAHTFGVVKGPVPLVRELVKDERAIINVEKCLIFYSQGDEYSVLINEVATTLKG